MKTYCDGGGSAPIERRFQRTLLADHRGWLGKCGHCHRILKPIPESGLLRRHSVRGKNTASLDKTREFLWAYAEPEPDDSAEQLERRIEDLERQFEDLANVLLVDYTRWLFDRQNIEPGRFDPLVSEFLAQRSTKDPHVAQGGQ